jgi:SAM-dependent methyltransferase
VLTGIGSRVLFPDLSQRRREAEWMDEDGVDPRLLNDSLRFIRRINSLLLYTRATISHLDRFSRSWEKGRRIEIVDLATGSADVPRAILQWADRRAFDVHITAVDRHAVTAQAAMAEGTGDPRLSILHADVFNLPFADRSFDYALTSMFLHHLDTDAVVAVMATMGRLARRGVIIADLIRDRRAYLWASLFTALANPMVRHDARVSVAQAFVKGEVIEMRDRAGLEFALYRRHFGHRFVLAGER